MPRADARQTADQRIRLNKHATHKKHKTTHNGQAHAHVRERNTVNYTSGTV